MKQVDLWRSLVDEVQQISRHVNAIVESAREQSVGIQEINTAVNSIDQSTQQNAAMVEESTAASHNLAGEADALNKLIAQFNLCDQKAIKEHVHLAPHHSHPTVSPARALGKKVASAFGSSSLTATSWSEF